MKLKLMLGLVLMFGVTPVWAQPPDATCEVGLCWQCLGSTCVAGACYGNCYCTNQCIKINGFNYCGCFEYGGDCTTDGLGNKHCSGGTLSADGKTYQCAKGKPIDDALLKSFPWTASAEFVQKVSHGNSAIRFLLTGMQQTIAKRGLGDVMKAQMGNYIGPKPEKPTAENTHLSEFYGMVVAAQPSGAYIIHIYHDVAHEGGETKYKSLGGIMGQVAPEVTITVLGHEYARAVVGGDFEEGTF